jgi:uncharacterized integral membrane protein
LIYIFANVLKIKLHLTARRRALPLALALLESIADTPVTSVELHIFSWHFKWTSQNF